MSKKRYLISIRSFLVLCLWCAILQTISSAVHAEASGEEGVRASGPLVKKEQRRTLVSSEDGDISAVRVADNINGSYLLHFFTLEPNSLFLPAILHADMVFYVHTGSGKLSWTEEDELKSTELTRGDVYRLEQGAVFFIRSNLETETERQKLRIHAIFANLKNDLHEPATGPYSSIRDMVLGFDKQVLKAAFKVPEEVINELLNGTSPPAIVHGLPRKAAAFEAEFVRSLLGSRSYNIFELNKKKKSGAKVFNLLKEDKDFENCNGWSTTVTRKKLSALKGTDIGLFMVNLTVGSMMGPHWNPTATEIAVVLQGRGMIRVVCSSISNETQCRNMRFEVGEGDVFAVPKFHPMAQISFNNEVLVFMGFSTKAKRNHPQFLAGQASVFRSLDKDLLAMSFNVTSTTLDQILAPQHDSVILGCVSCAEGELRIMEEEREREREEAREKEEEETRRREKEEARKREEEAARREEEERRQEAEAEAEAEAAARRKEEEERRREEEVEERERQREEEEARRREQEEESKREEAAARREEQERRRKEEEEEEEEAAARRKEEEERRREGEEEAEARPREQEEEQSKREEAAARREEEERKRREEERQREKEEEKETSHREEEQAKERRREEAARREEEERIRREEEERRRQKEEQVARQRKEEEAKQKEEEQAEARRREEEVARREEKERIRREEEERRGAEEREQGHEEEEARREHQEQEARRREEQQHGRSEEERAAEGERKREEETKREEAAAKRRERERGE